MKKWSYWCCNNWKSPHFVPQFSCLSPKCNILPWNNVQISLENNLHHLVKPYVFHHTNHHVHHHKRHQVFCHMNQHICTSKCNPLSSPAEACNDQASRSARWRKVRAPASKVRNHIAATKGHNDKGNSRIWSERSSPSAQQDHLWYWYFDLYAASGKALGPPVFTLATSQKKVRLSFSSLGLRGTLPSSIIIMEYCNRVLLDHQLEVGKCIWMWHLDVQDNHNTAMWYKYHTSNITHNTIEIHCDAHWSGGGQKSIKKMPSSGSSVNVWGKRKVAAGGKKK